MLRLLHRLRAPLAACALAPLALTACGAPAAPSATAESPTAQATTAFSPSPGAHGSRDGADGHGHVEGAEELEEAATSLAVLSATGELSLIGLEDLSVTPVTRVEGATTVATDRRLLALGGAEGRVSLADSGVWTQDHGDHQHYYRAPATALGPLAEPAAAGGRAAVEAESAPPTIASSAQYTAVTAGGRMTLLDRRALEQGEIAPVSSAEVDPGSYAAPLGAHVLAVRQGRASLLDKQGTAVGDPLPCPQASGGIATRAGVVLGCEGGAVVASLPHAQAQAPVLEWVALPETAPAGTRLVSFGARPGRATLAALDSRGGWWLLHTRERRWSGPQADPAETTGPGAQAPLVAVCALGDTRNRVVGVDTEGRIHVWAEGATEAVTDPLASPELASRSGIHATADRVYLPAASGEEILEIDPQAQAAVERTIPAPGLLAFQMVGA